MISTRESVEAAYEYLTKHKKTKIGDLNCYLNTEHYTTEEKHRIAQDRLERHYACEFLFRMAH